ncbi:hypothetical protein Ancab_006246 [Ancistrocladus abbreviatus]
MCPDRASHASVPSYDDAKFAENQRSTSDRVVQRSAGVASGTGTVPGGEQFQRENMFEFSNNGLHVSCEFVPQPQFEDGAGVVLDKWGKSTGLELGISLHQISDLDLSKDDIDDEWVARDGEGRILGQKIGVLRWRPMVLKAANLATYLMDVRGGGQRGGEVWRRQQRASVVLVAAFSSYRASAFLCLAPANSIFFPSFEDPARNERLETMAGTDSQKQLLTLIRDYATEKSNGDSPERRIVNLKKQIQQLQSQIDAANAELENAKRLKETTEQELKGYEVELAMNQVTIQTLEARIAWIHNEISTVGSDVNALKNEEGALRDKFINQMLEFNTKIRRFHDLMIHSIQKESCIRGPSGEDHDNMARKDAEFIALEKKISTRVSQTVAEEHGCEKEKDLHMKLQHDLVDLQRKLDLMEAIRKDMKELQDLTRYPYQCHILFLP